MPCVSPPVYDDSNDEDDGNEEDDNDNNEEDNNDKNNNKEDICDFDLDGVDGMSKDEVLCLQRIHRTQEPCKTREPRSARGHDVRCLLLRRPHQ